MFQLHLQIFPSYILGWTYLKSKIMNLNYEVMMEGIQELGGLILDV